MQPGYLPRHDSSVRSNMKDLIHDPADGTVRNLNVVEFPHDRVNIRSILDLYIVFFQVIAMTMP